MKQRLLSGGGIVLLAILVTIIVWQVSFSFGEYRPSSPEQTYALWAASLMVFLLTVFLGFMLIRNGIKLYIERNSNREGSRIKSKLVFGAVALTLLPAVFLFLFSYAILNRNLDKWFAAPVDGVKRNLVDVGRGFENEIRERAAALANWIAMMPETRAAADGEPVAVEFFRQRCRESRIEQLTLAAQSGERIELCSAQKGEMRETPQAYSATAAIRAGTRALGTIVVRATAPVDLAAKQAEIDNLVKQYDQLSANRRFFRNIYLMILLLITMFVLFVSTWVAMFLARQISVPISALLGAAGEVRRGNLSHRVDVKAIDELATLVRAFNEMTNDLETSSRELENRRRFTEAILESIPTGVISLDPDGRILRINRALRGFFSEEHLDRATRMEDLFPAEEITEIRYLMKRAGRTGLAASQIEIKGEEKMLHLAVTVSALPASAAGGTKPGFVLVLEDTSELLRAQKAEAWHEVARRIAHELKNPLTPIALSAERIARQLQRGGLGTVEGQRVISECAATISREVESVKNLADEFSRFSRFPAAQPVPCDLNEIVRNGIDVFADRLVKINLRLDLAPNLPLVQVDPEQIKRVVVNLVDNAAEAMHDMPVRNLLVATYASGPDTVELVVADSGSGVSASDKEKLFLPYFSTKNRGTGLGLAIVSHILAEHGASIRVEDNRPSGARFLVEIPALVMAEAEVRV